MDWSSKKVFVTGATGFVGSNLIKKLSELNADITLLVREYNPKFPSKIKQIKGDLTKGVFDLSYINYIFHTAAIVGATSCSLDKNKAYSVNVLGTENILLSLNKPKNLEKFIYLSTSNVYGNQCGVNEEGLIDLKDFYSKTKFLGENKLTNFNRIQKIPYSIIRMANLYGPGKVNGIIPLIMRSIKENREIPINNAKIDFLYIDDALSGILKVAESGQGIYNLGPGQNFFISQILSILEAKLRKKANISSFTSSSQNICLDITKIKKLGWEPKIDLIKGLEKTIYG